MAFHSLRIHCKHILENRNQTHLARQLYTTANRWRNVSPDAYSLSLLNLQMLRRTYTSTKSPAPSAVGPTIIRELKKADINVTPFGKQAIIASFESMSSSNLKKSHLPWILHAEYSRSGKARGSADSNLYCLHNSSISPWRLDTAFDECIDYKVHKMWEALYSKSELFRNMIAYEEEDVREMQSIDMDQREVRGRYLWQLLSNMLCEGIIELSDVDNLPEPFKFSNLPGPPYPPADGEDND
ncbi:hypothetical protein TWF696_008925 [Orbilia brochopaga]|uniref:Uncharacterized protein n=1 Tax=Orbilia brochopaga TaxID=3140254 RepID=A0AAV9UEA3_9PEZI